MSDERSGDAPGTLEPAAATVKRILPLARVRRIMKSDTDVRLISGDAVQLVARACELFIQQFVGEAYEFARREKRRIMQYRDFVRAMQSVDQFDFLEDIVPDTAPTPAKKRGRPARKAATAAADNADA